MATSKPMPSFPSLSELLRSFLDLYEKDRVGVCVALQDSSESWLPEGMEYVPLREQLALILESTRRSQSEIKRKTLIETGGSFPRQRQLRELIDDPSKLKSFLGSSTSRDIATIFAEEQGISVEQFIADDIKEELGRKKLDVELLRFFADRLDAVANAIEQFDNTRFDLLIPSGLAAPFRELHINAALGNYGTACILCGALLERTLQDLIPSKSLLNDLIKEAKKDGLLKGHNNRFADRIRDDRNDVVHGKVEFGSISSDHAWETVSCTRTLISALYKDRLH
jgi:hypothetical protein